MISKLFLDKIIELYFKQKDKLQFNLDILTNDLKKIISFEISDDEVPVKLLNQFELCKCLVHEINWEDTTPEYFIENISSDNKFYEFKSLLKYHRSQDLTENQLNEIIKLIEIKKESLHIKKDTEQLEKFLDKYNNNEFGNSVELVKNFEKIISKIYTRTILKSKSDFIETSKNFMFDTTDDIQKCLKIVSDYRNNTSKVKTGIESFDSVLKGGFDKNRIYIIGGTPGVGKSLFLLHFLLKTLFYDDNDPGLYVYITLENMVNETLDRLYTMIPNYYDEYTSFKSPEQALNEKILNARKKDRLFAINYMPSYNTDANDIMIYIDKLIIQTGLKPKILFIDYLDLMTSINKTELYRLELGYITMELKILSLKYGIPVITPTQLNSSGYNEIPTLGSLTESKKKAEHADFVGILNNRSFNKNNLNGLDELNKVLLLVQKNRNGPLKHVSFDVNYNTFKITDSKNSSNISMQNNTINNTDKNFESSTNFVNLF